MKWAYVCADPSDTSVPYHSYRESTVFDKPYDIFRSEPVLHSKAVMESFR